MKVVWLRRRLDIRPGDPEQIVLGRHSRISRLVDDLDERMMVRSQGGAGRSLFKSNGTSTRTLITAKRLLDSTALGISNVPYCRDVTTCLGAFGRLIGCTNSGRKVWDLDLRM